MTEMPHEAGARVILSSMDTLPFVDDHTLRIAAPAESVWRALLRTVRSSFAVTLPKPILMAWGLAETGRSAAQTGSVTVGDTFLGFRVAECAPDQLLALSGRHRFSRYELRFELEPLAGGDVTLHAKTFAIFPGWAGRLYRSLVIGTGGHRLVVRRMLRSVARRVSDDGLRGLTSPSP